MAFLTRFLGATEGQHIHFIHAVGRLLHLWCSPRAEQSHFSEPNHRVHHADRPVKYHTAHMTPAVALTLSIPASEILFIHCGLSPPPAELPTASCSQPIADPASDAAPPPFPPPSECYSHSRFSSSSPPQISSLIIHLRGYLLHLWDQLPYSARHSPNPGLRSSLVPTISYSGALALIRRPGPYL